MDSKTQSFLELTAKDDLVQLVADKKAAWLWSADGAHILWANAAGASFFSAQTVSDLVGLSSLGRSPARPHIARIAESGSTDKFSIDRLRFYRGLRVMLLTCQCKKLELGNGEAAALIVCGDKGLSATRAPVSAFARMLKSETSTVFLTSGGSVNERFGALEGTPEDLEVPNGQKALFGPMEIDGGFHEGAILEFAGGQNLIVLNNAPLADDDNAEETPDETPAPTSALPAARDLPEEPAETEADAAPAEPETSEGDQDETSAWVRADAAELEDEPEEADRGAEPVVQATEANLTEDEQTAAGGEEQPEVADEPVAEAAAETEEAQPLEDASAEAVPDADVTDDETEAEADADAEMPADDTESENAFVFQPRRRPVRFAWKMDIDQRFTFLSDEFAEVLGPVATDIVGQTWEEVSDMFGLDPRGHIARALDRRDTWSGKTVDWPVTGAELRVPVDMAALPAFDRNRKFEGYRGFGVCRTADAIRDPDSLLLSAAVAAAPIALVASSGEDREEPETEAGISESEEELVAGAEEETAALDTDATSEAEATEVAETLEEETLEASAEEAVDELTAEAEDLEASSGQPDEDGDAGESLATEQEKGAAQNEALANLKPAQPDSFAGKTFLGASAAAIVGSLTKFTSKTPQEPREEQQTVEDAEDQGEQLSLTEDLQRAAAALDREPEEPADETGEVPVSEEVAEDLEETVTAEAEDAADEGEEGDEAADDDAAGLSADLPEEATEPAPADTASDLETGDEADDETVRSETADEEPVGISGPAELKPAEIESAVKSLAKSYKAPEKLSPDLFDEAEAADGDGEADALGAGETADSELTEPEQPSEDAGLTDEDSEEPADAAELTARAEPDADQHDADEREFFEETAAYEQEEKAAAEDAENKPDVEPKTTGEVIPLATVKPRVVPVDTSGLSRPERQAFRKIAEALGARLEGDLDEFDAPDPEEEVPVEDLPPEVPEAGPIDPSLLDRLPIGISIVHDREVLYANKALLQMLGYKSIAALSQAGGLEALFIDDTEDLPDADGMDGEVDEAMKMRLADGGVLTVDAHMHSVPWNGSRGLMVSITERPVKQTAASEAPSSPNFFAEVRSELESARSQISEMDTILETATDGVLVLDQHGSILKVNGSAEALFSANRSDMIGAPFTEFLAPESHRAAADYLDGLSRNGVASILNDGREVLGTVPTGGLIPLFMTMGRITGGKDDAKFCVVLRDITQWKTAEEELTQAKRQAENASSAKSDFLAKISHEIRTPLNAIIGFSEVMMEERFGPIGNDRYKDYLKDIRTSGSHIMSLINDLLDLSKIEAGKLDLKFSAVSTNDVINECVALMQPQANRERVIIRASLPDSVPDVVADPRSLRQIVLNLLSNAIKYNKSGGQVILSTALESNGEVALRVRDTGTGMTAKQLAAALEPFRQLHTASRGGGTGLGLPLTKALVEANRASFHIDSTPDQGTLVEIIFPTQRVLSE